MIQGNALSDLKTLCKSTTTGAAIHKGAMAAAGVVDVELVKVDDACNFDPRDMTLYIPRTASKLDSAVAVHELLHAWHFLKDIDGYFARRDTEHTLWGDQEEELTITGYCGGQKLRGENTGYSENAVLTELGLPERTSHDNAESALSREEHDLEQQGMTKIQKQKSDHDMLATNAPVLSARMRKKKAAMMRRLLKARATRTKSKK